MVRLNETFIKRVLEEPGNYVQTHHAGSYQSDSVLPLLKRLASTVIEGNSWCSPHEREIRIRNDFVAVSQRTLSTSAHSTCMQQLQSALNRSFWMWSDKTVFTANFLLAFLSYGEFVDVCSLFFCISFFHLGLGAAKLYLVLAIVLSYHHFLQNYKEPFLSPNLSLKKSKKVIFRGWEWW